MVDKSRIESRILKENYLLLLGLPISGGRGYVPLRVIGREFFYYEYDPLQEGQLTAKVPAGTGVDGIDDLGFVSPSRLSSSYLTGKPYNVFSVQEYSHLFQLFYGIAPSALRVYLEAPAATGQRNLDIDRWASNRLQFGYVDGFDSPFLSPSPDSEMLIPPLFDFAFGYGNPLPTLVSPLLMFVVNRLQVAVVLDPDLVEKMLEGKVPVAIKTVGGLSTFSYNVAKYYGVDPIPLGSSMAVIESSLAAAPAPKSLAPTTQQRRGA